MLLEAACDFDIDLARSVLIGDKSSDVECARRGGCRVILVATGYGASQTCDPDFRAANLAEAAGWILRNLLPAHFEGDGPRH
jgi:D-glycero-D-manno-heptose 1,7-bisphosphate phosphatase